VPVEADVRDARAVADVLASHEPSHVVHLAYIMDPVHDGNLEHDVNVQGTRNVFEAAQRTPSVTQFVLMSSISVYGAHPGNPEWIAEDAPLRPGAYSYARHKKTSEEHCLGAPRREDMNVVVLRMCTAAGPGYTRPGGVVRAIARLPLLPSVIGGDGRIQFIHEEDLAALVWEIVSDDDVSGVFNLCPDSYSTIPELRRELGRAVAPVPLVLLKAVLGLLWHLRIASVTPAMAALMAHGIVATPAKIVGRYGYTFAYSAREAFLDAVQKRRRKGTL
jgi:UDP-glucose 4-epimerase